MSRSKFLVGALAVLLWTSTVWAQRCVESKDMDPATRGAIESTAQQFFQMAAAGNATGLQQNSIPAVAQNFGGIASAVQGNASTLQGAQPQIRKIFLLDASDATATLERAEFYCGVFGAYGHTNTSTAFIIPGLPPGKYAIAIVDAQGGQKPFTISMVLQQESGAWKLAGYYAKAGEAAGHDGEWFAQQARDYQQKGQTRNAYFYFWQARDLLAPVPFISTLKLDRLYDEMQKVTPPDLPIGGQPATLSVEGKTIDLTNIYPVPVGNEMDLVVKYKAADISDVAKTWASNMAVINALLAKYPEFREAFQGVVARAVGPDGHDYGTLAPTKQTPNAPQSASQ